MSDLNLDAIELSAKECKLKHVHYRTACSFDNDFASPDVALALITRIREDQKRFDSHTKEQARESKAMRVLTEVSALVDEFACVLIGRRRIVDGPGAWMPGEYTYEDSFRAHGELERIADSMNAILSAAEADQDGRVNP